MTWTESLRSFLGLSNVQGMPVPVETRTSVSDLLQRIDSTAANPWRAASPRQALGVPAVFRARTLIANSLGVLSLEAYRNGAKLGSDDTPRVIVRPNPLTTPRVFFRDCGDYLSGWGELWLYVAKRDGDGQALSVLPVDPREVTVEQNSRNYLRPIIQWRGVTMANEDFRQVTMLRDPSNPLRGIGPLQACGAAVSVAVESQEWAANFFSDGGIPSTIIKTSVDMDETEANLFKSKWTATPNNTPRIITPTVESVDTFGFSPEQATLSQTRLDNVGDVARMFGIPGPLLEYSAPGSSLTYQNISSIWQEFQSSCLTPNYLEPIEQEMSDLLTRSTVCRFNLDELLRGDIMTRMNAYNIGIPLGVIPLEAAQAAEGYAAGDVENRPVPIAPPAAIPTVLPIQGRSAEAVEVRCEGRIVRQGNLIPCRKLLGEFAKPYRLLCPRCRTENAAA